MKKGQMTIFIILGVLILVSVSLFFILNRSQDTGRLRFVSEQVPLEFQPVQSFVESCLFATTVDAVKLLGERGGYTVQEFAPGLPTESAAVRLFDLDRSLPYYLRLSAPNTCDGNCEFAYGMPHLRKAEGAPSLEGQLDQYIAQTLPACLDFSVFAEQGLVVEPQAALAIDSIINEDDLDIIILYPLLATSQNADQLLQHFKVTLSVDLADAYAVALEITNMELTYHFLEKHIINMLVGFSGLKKILPPMFDMDFDPAGGRQWSKAAIADTVTQHVLPTVNLLQVLNSRNHYFRNLFDEAEDAYYNRGMLVPLQETDPGLYNIYFSYFPPDLGWEPYFELNCDGDVCGAMEVSSNLAAVVGIQRYKFLYDVSFPVMIELHQPDELANEIPGGFRFLFALEGNIRDNRPLHADYSRKVGVPLVEASLLCEERNSGDVTLFVSDIASGEPLDDTRISYTCGDESCLIGTTDLDGQLQAQFPICLGGIVTYHRASYLQYHQPFNAQLEVDRTLAVELLPIRDTRLEVVKKIYRQGQVSAAQTLSAAEEAVVTFERQNALADEDYLTIVQYEGNPVTVPLAPGTYTVSMHVLHTEQITIAAEEHCVALECFTTESVTLNDTIIGGVETTLRITPAQQGTLVLTALTIDPSQLGSLSSYAAIGNLTQYYREFQEELRPRFR